MAKKSTSAQHFLECDNCEENPAKFLCKTCPGHLCENCKIEHETKKITRSHEIVSLLSNNEDMVDLLYCTEHTKKKLECYCNRCKEPVCTNCIMQSHNGHSVEPLSTAYKKITDHARQQKENIDNILLPKYKELLSNETAKQSALRKRAEEIKTKIEAHTNSLVEMIKSTSTQTVEDLSKIEKDGLWEIEQTKNNFKEQIHELQQMSSTISANIEAKPDISFFKLDERINLKGFEKTPPKTDYSFTDFLPGNIGRALQENFGTRPILQISGNNSDSDGEVEGEPVPREPTLADDLRSNPHVFQGYQPYEERGRKKPHESDGEVEGKPVQREPTFADYLRSNPHGRALRIMTYMPSGMPRTKKQ